MLRLIHLTNGPLSITCRRGGGGACDTHTRLEFESRCTHSSRKQRLTER